jgi:hypothetical protein
MQFPCYWSSLFVLQLSKCRGFFCKLREYEEWTPMGLHHKFFQQGRFSGGSLDYNSTARVVSSPMAYQTNQWISADPTSGVLLRADDGTPLNTTNKYVSASLLKTCTWGPQTLFLTGNMAYPGGDSRRTVQTFWPYARLSQDWRLFPSRCLHKRSKCVPAQ